MSDELANLVKRLVADPSQLRAVAPEVELALIANLRAALSPEEQPMPSLPAGTTPHAVGFAKLLTVREAADLLNLSPRWLYRKAKSLPFSRKLSRKVLRFEAAGLARWVATRRA